MEKERVVVDHMIKAVVVTVGFLVLYLNLWIFSMFQVIIHVVGHST